MPQRSLKPCAKPGCPALIRAGRFCELHEKQIAAAYEAQRGSAVERGYGATWRKVRAMYLKEHPYCEDPEGLHEELVKATDVDHVISKRNGGTDDEGNLQALCHSCHSRKTAKEDGRWIKK